MKYTSPVLFLATLLLAIVATGCGKVPPNPNISSYEQNADETPDIITSSTAVSPIKNEDFVGDWNVEGGMYEQITVNEDGTYDTYLHERLFNSGTWKYVVGSMIFDSPAFEKTIYSEVKKDGEKLILKNGEGKNEVWSKIIM